MPKISGLEKIELGELTPNTSDVFIVGIIIAKQQPRKFADNKEAGRERAVWNFTFRDSPFCYINVTCWGSKESIFELNDRFHMGDVVDIMQPQIEIRNVGDNGENFRPRVTSPFHLILSECPELKLVSHEGNCQAFYKLLHLPTKPVAGAYTIADIHNRKDRIEGVDLLGVVRSIGRVRNVNTREGGVQQVREVVILDQTSPSLRITIWDPDLIIRASTWKVCNTVLFVTDVRCEWSNFNRCMVANLTSRTVLTEDPVALECNNLKKYAETVPIEASEMLNHIAGSITNVQTIQNVMNAQQILDKMESMVNSPNGAEEQQFTALMYAVVTQLDLDGLSRLTSSRCSQCNALLPSTANKCIDTECPVGSGQQEGAPVTTFDLRITLTDQTGSLLNCRLSGQVAQTVLNCTVTQFLGYSDEEKSILKWKHLMERRAIRILVICNGFWNPIISILSWDEVSPLEVANRLPHS